MEKSIIINSFQGGLSNTKTIGQEGSFYDSKSIDYRKNPEFVSLNRTVTESFSVTSRPNVIAITNYSGSANLVDEVNLYCEDGAVYGSSGEIYSNTTSSDPNQTGFPILNLANLNGYNYMLCSNRIERFINAVYENVLATNDFSSGWT